MGCDIHLFAEKRIGGKWVTAETWIPDEDADGRMGVPYAKRIYTERNYDFFALLAGVRNYSVITPMVEPRGLPSDVCTEVRAESDAYGVDGHTHSWLTLAELLAFDWTQTFEATGIIDAVTFSAWLARRDRDPEPSEWCRGVGGPNIKMLTLPQMEEKISHLRTECGYGTESWNVAMFDGRLKHDLYGYYCKVEWEISYARECAYFWWKAIPVLLRMGNPEDVRIVFWFDN